jgi:hypothetical protein
MNKTSTVSITLPVTTNLKYKHHPTIIVYQASIREYFKSIKQNKTVETIIPIFILSKLPCRSMISTNKTRRNNEIAAMFFDNKSIGPQEGNNDNKRGSNISPVFRKIIKSENPY